MKIMVIGLGVIGTTYAYCFQKAGHTVKHFIRDNKQAACPQKLEIDLLDGRHSKKGIAKQDLYSVEISPSDGSYDFIFVSVSSGKLGSVISSLQEKGITGTLVLFCGIWQDRNELDKILNGWDFILAYPVAGGTLNQNRLECVIFDHIMLERREKAHISNYDSLLELLKSAKIEVECPYDMLEWIWLHMAINAAVITTIAKYGKMDEISHSAETAMNSPRILSEVVRAVRETANIISSRGVQLEHYKNELLPYKIPAFVAGRIMCHMFRTNELTRKIMLLHSNVDDLLYVCKNVYDCGVQNQIDAPIFYKNYETMCEKISSM